MTHLLPSHAHPPAQGILRAMDGLPVTLRLLDPPLHEFLPDGEMTEVGLTVQACVLQPTCPAFRYR